MRTQRPPARGERRERDDVVLDDHVGRELVDDLEQPPVDVARAVAERLERRRDELAELLDRRLAEDRRRVADEVDPELPGRLLLLRRRARGASAAPRSRAPRACPANDSSTMKTTRCPRSRSTAPMPAQLLVGPCAPSGKKTIVAIGVRPRRRAMRHAERRSSRAPRPAARRRPPPRRRTPRRRRARTGCPPATAGREHGAALGHQARPGEPRVRATLSCTSAGGDRRDAADERAGEQADDGDDQRDAASAPCRRVSPSRRGGRAP